MRVKAIAEINPAPSTPIEARPFIDYIDTASVNEGRLNEVQHLVDEFPSRAQREVYANDILISSVRPNLKHNYFVKASEHGMIASSGFVQLRVKEPDVITPNFLYYFLTSPSKVKYYSRIAESSQSAYPSFNKDVIEEIDLPDIPIVTQLRIAGILGSLDEKIELNRRKIAELEALAQTIYDYWFVQFDFPDANGKPYKSSGGKMVWNEQLKREVPEGWKVGCVDDLGEIVSGGTPSTTNPSYWTQDGIAWITPKDLSDTENKYIRHGLHDISNEGLNNSSAQLMPAGSVILSTRAPIGYIAIADCALSTNQGFKSIIPKTDIGSEFVYYTILNLIPYIKTLGVGSTFAEVSKTAYASIQVLIPPKKIRNDFEKIMSPIGRARCVCENNIKENINQRDNLLPLLMNGQIKVAE